MWICFTTHVTFNVHIPVLIAHPSIRTHSAQHGPSCKPQQNGELYTPRGQTTCALNNNTSYDVKFICIISRDKYYIFIVHITQIQFEISQRVEKCLFSTLTKYVIRSEFNMWPHLTSQRLWVCGIIDNSEINKGLFASKEMNTLARIQRSQMARITLKVSFEYR